MFEFLHPLPAGRVLVAVHQMLGIVRHYKSYPPEDRAWYARAKAKVAGDTETDLALSLIEEIERAEGTPLAEMEPDVVERHLDPLRDYALERKRKELPPGTRSAPGRRWRRCGAHGNGESPCAPERSCFCSSMGTAIRPRSPAGCPL